MKRRRYVRPVSILSEVALVFAVGFTGDAGRAKMHNFFRSEVGQFRRGKIEGEVLRFQSAGHRAVVFASLALLLVGGFSAALLPIPQTARLRGLVAPDKGLMRLPVQDDWRVVEILAAEGQVLTAGQPVARVELIRSLIANTGGRAVADAQKTRLDAQAEQGAAENRARAAEIKALGAELEGQKAVLTQIEKQIELGREREALAIATLERAQTLMDRGFLTRFDLDSRRYTLLSERAGLAVLERERAEGIVAIRSTAARLDGLVAAGGAAEQAHRGARASLAIDVSQALQDQTYVTAAPRAGRLLLLNYQVGEATRANTPLAIIEPLQARPSIDFYASPDDALRLRANQAVIIKIDGLDRGALRPLKGVILSVSPLIRPAEEVSAPGLNLTGPVLAVRVRLEGETLPVSLSPGMTAVGSVVVDRRSMLQRFLRLGSS